MVRGMVSARAVIQKERFFRGDLLGIPNELDSLVRQVLGEVITVLGAGGLVHLVIIIDQIGIPLVGLAAQEAVETLETAPQGPVPP